MGLLEDTEKILAMKESNKAERKAKYMAAIMALPIEERTRLLADMLFDAMNKREYDFAGMRF
jgi:hypothetical protein